MFRFSRVVTKNKLLREQSNLNHARPFQLEMGYNSWWPGGNFEGVKDWLVDPGYWPIDFKNRTGVDEDTKNRGPNCMRVFGDSKIKLSAPPSMVNLSIIGRDNYGYVFSGGVWIDEYFAGQAGMTIRIKAGTHNITVTPPAWYSMHYYKIGSQQYPPGRLTYHFAQDTTIEVRFVWHPHYWSPTLPHLIISVYGGDAFCGKQPHSQPPPQ
jgi:hypothetical protein